MAIYTNHEEIKTDSEHLNGCEVKFTKVLFASAYLNGNGKPTLFLALNSGDGYPLYGEEHINNFLRKAGYSIPFDNFGNDGFDLKELKGKKLVEMVKGSHIRAICVGN